MNSYNKTFSRKSLCLFLSAVLVACNPSKESVEDAALATMIVEPADCRTESEYTARLAGQQVVEVRPQVSGLITRICIEEGQKVRRGQLLFVIDQVPYKAAFDEAEANVRIARAGLSTAQVKKESIVRLRESGVVEDYDLKIAESDLLAAEGALQLAEAQLVKARNDLSYTEVRSPVDGVAGMITFRVGALVSSSTSEPLVSVSDNSRMYAYFSLPEGHVQDLVEEYGTLDSCIARMPEVELRMSNGRPYPVKGRVAAVSGIVTEGTGSVALRADFPNVDGLLIGGGSGTVVIPSMRHQCLVVPQGATFELQERTFVYRVEQGKASMTAVRVTPLSGGRQYVIEEGLQPGDTIVAEGAGLVKDGVLVNPNPAKK